MTGVTDQRSRALEGRLGEVHLRVANAHRAANFFGQLCGPDAENMVTDPHHAHRVAAVLTDDPTAAPVRLCFQTPEPVAALARTVELGGSGTDVVDARDDQGTPLGFYATAAGSSRRRPGGVAMGPTLLLAPDVTSARQFHTDLFGQTFHTVGSGDFWWVSSGPPFGIFPAGHEVTNPEHPSQESSPTIQVFFTVGDLDRAVVRVEQLGGTALQRGALGHFQVCDCRDDQGLRFGLWCDSSQEPDRL